MKIDWEILERLDTVGVALIDTNGRIQQATHVFARIIGRDHHDIEGVHVSDFTASGDRDATEARLQRLMAGETVHTHKQYIRPSGEVVSCQLEAVPIDGVAVSFIYALSASNSSQLDMLKAEIENMRQLIYASVGKDVNVNVSNQTNTNTGSGDLMSAGREANKTTQTNDIRSIRWLAIVAIVVTAIVATIVGVQFKGSWWGVETTPAIRAGE